MACNMDVGGKHGKDPELRLGLSQLGRTSLQGGAISLLCGFLSHERRSTKGSTGSWLLVVLPSGSRPSPPACQASSSASPHSL